MRHQVAPCWCLPLCSAYLAVQLLLHAKVDCFQHVQLLQQLIHLSIVFAGSSSSCLQLCLALLCICRNRSFCCMKS